MTLDEARSVIANYESAELRSVHGVSGKSTFEIFAKDNGIILVADAVSRVVRARRVIEQHRKESEGK